MNDSEGAFTECKLLRISTEPFILTLSTRAIDNNLSDASVDACLWERLENNVAVDIKIVDEILPTAPPSIVLLLRYKAQHRQSSQMILHTAERQQKGPF